MKKFYVIYLHKFIKPWIRPGVYQLIALKILCKVTSTFRAAVYSIIAQVQ